MTKYIINNTTYTSKTAQPHGHLRDILIDAKLNGYTIKIVRE